MRILIAVDNKCAHYYINRSLAKALTACGHQVIMWDMQKKAPMDAFDEFLPDLYIGHTYTIDNGFIKCFEEHPACMCILKASDWGIISDNLDRQKYPILIANPKEIDTLKILRDKTGKPDFLFIHYCEHRLKETHTHWINDGFRTESMLSGADIFDYCNGIEKPEFKCDIGFVGGYWPYKAQTLSKYILPLCNYNSKYRVKIFGNQGWNVPQFCGFLPDEEVKNLFKSATICPSISELHSQDLGFDIIERTFKICASKGFCISDYVEDLEKMIPNGIIYAKSPAEFFQKIEYYIDKPEKRAAIAEKGYQEVIKKHTYFHRAAHMFDKLGRPDLALQTLTKFSEVKEKLSL